MLWFFVWFGVGSAVENAPVVPQIQADIQVDGELNEAVWNQALKLTLDYEVRPGENIQPPVQTIVRMFTSETHLYVAFFCQDPNPQAIRSQYSDRDDVFNGDFAGIVLDTFNDQRRAYEFVCNPFGIQADAINDDLNGNYDLSWNALWTSKGKIQDNGWSFEMKIPVHQLRFNPSDTAQIWGFDAFRSYPRSQRHHIGFFPRDRAVNSYLAQEAKLLGFSDLKPGKNLEVVPTVTGFQSETRPQFPNGGLEKTNDDTEAGVSVRWGITPNMTLNATANPDFSQVEADAVQLDINETFSLYYNETRPFFLEGSDYFTTPFNLLHTRSIADPKGAMKLTGKSGKHTYGLLTAQDEQTTVVLPGVESSKNAQFNQNANDYVGRYRYDFGNNSTAGALVTAREGNGYHNQVLSFDSQYNSTSNDVFTVNLASSDTRYNDTMQETLETDRNASGQAYYLRYRHSERNWNTTYSYTDITDGFRSDLGFRPQVGYKKLVAGAERIWHLDGSGYFNRITVGGDWDMTEDQHGNLIEREYEMWFPIQARNQTNFNLWGGTRDRVFQGKEYNQQYWGIYYETSPTRWLNFYVEWQAGDWIDFAHNRKADRNNTYAGFNLRMGNHFRWSMDLPYQSLDVAEGELFHAFLPQARLVYFHNERWFIRAILQYTSVTRNEELYDFDVHSENKDLFSQLLFSYKLNAQTLAFIGYSDSYLAYDDLSLTQSGRNFFVKFSYAWLP